MDKITGEEDFKGLEEEIDDAVDRLFVENKRGVGKRVPTESQASATSLKSLIEEPSIKSPTSEPSVRPTSREPSVEPSPESHLESHLESQLESHLESPISELSVNPPDLDPVMKPSFLEPSDKLELERNLNFESSTRSTSIPVQSSNSIENMEAQLLSLEWEITEEKLKKTREEVLALGELLKTKPDIRSILSDMEKVLTHMIQNEEDIQPSWIKFLLDSKETIKLLTKEQAGGQVDIYKQLAYLGIEARFSCLEGMRDSKIIEPSSRKGEGAQKMEVPLPGEKKIEDLSNKMNLFMGKVEEIFSTMKQQISRLEETTRKPPEPPMENELKPVNITIVKVEEKLFGVESERVFKLFKVPNTFHKKYSNQQRIRLRDFEVKIINLKKILAIQGSESKGETKILAVRDNGEYKGFMVDQVLKKISTHSEREGEVGEYFSGVIRSTYQDRSVEIPILDLKKF